MEELVLKYGFTYGPLMLFFLGVGLAVWKWGPIVASTMAALFREMTAALNASTVALNNSSVAIERNTEVMLKHGEIATMVQRIYTILVDSKEHQVLKTAAEAATERMGRNVEQTASITNYGKRKGRSMTNKIAAVFAFMLVCASSFAGDMGTFTFERDRMGANNFVMTATLYTNEVVANTTPVSATCPTPAQFIKFDPGVSTDFRIKANGTGAPTGAAVTDGTGWRNNVSELLPINRYVSGTLVNYYSVYSTVSNVVPYACYAK